MKYTTITCAWCGEKTEKRAAEIKRQNKKGRYHFFCSRSCSVQYGNSLKGYQREPITKICPQCNQPFEAMTGRKEPTFCSRECASKGSVTPARRRAGRQLAMAYPPKNNSIEDIAAILLSREMWKYERLRNWLNEKNIPHQFERPIGNGVFDLALLDRKLLIEFDGRSHKEAKQKERDAEKDSIAVQNGWSVVRIEVDDGQIFHPSLIADTIAA